MYILCNRVGNWLFGFSCELLVFCERKNEIAINSFPRVHRSCCSFVKSEGSKSLAVALSDNERIAPVTLYKRATGAMRSWKSVNRYFALFFTKKQTIRTKKQKNNSQPCYVAHSKKSEGRDSILSIKLEKAAVKNMVKTRIFLSKLLVFENKRAKV